MKPPKELIDYYVEELPTLEVPPQGIVFRKGDKATNAYIVASGEAVVCDKNNKGETVHLTTLRKGNMFGDLALFSDNRRTATVITETGCKVIVIRRESLEKKLREADPFLRFWIEYLSGRVISLSGRVDSDLGEPPKN